jgi:hypothetical protein
MVRSELCWHRERWVVRLLLERRSLLATVCHNSSASTLPHKESVAPLPSPPFTLPSFTALARLPDAFAPLCNRLPVQPARFIASVLFIGSPRVRPSLRHKQNSQLVGHLARSCTTISNHSIVGCSMHCGVLNALWGAQCTVGCSMHCGVLNALWGAQCTAPVRC